MPDISRRETSWGLVAGLTCAVFAIGQAVQISNGNLHPAAMRWLTFALLAVIVGALLPRFGWLQAHGEKLVVALIGLGAMQQFVQLLTTNPGMYLQIRGAETMVPFFSGLAIAALLFGAGLAKEQWLGRFWYLLPIACFLYLGVWLIKTSPDPFIDVYFFQRDGIKALLAGTNPYALRYNDIYGNSPFYGEGLSVNGQLQFGFPYPPMSMLAVLPFQVAFGDYRYAQLAAMCLTALIAMNLAPTRVGRGIALMYLFTPRTLFVLEQGWTEPVLVCGLAITVWFAIRFPRVLPWVLGLFLATKQYTVLLVPLVWLLLPVPRPSWREIAKLGAFTILAGALVSLPLALWNWHEFWFDVVALQVYQPFRTEALSYLAWWASAYGTRPPTSLAFIAALLGIAFSLWRLPKNAGGFAAGSALTMCLFFAFNKQAFCNYYSFVIGAAAVAVCALLGSETKAAEVAVAPVVKDPAPVAPVPVPPAVA